MHAVYVVERVLSRLAAEGAVARSWRLGSLRAGSQVIRAHVVRHVNDEREERASLARSALADSAVGAIISLDEISASGRVVEGSEFDFGGCSHEVSRGERFDREVASEAIFWPKRRAWGKCRARNFAC